MPKADTNKKTWEDSDVPALCESCLGPNPYVRMTREKYGAECKLCTRPFTVFRWSPEKGSKPRRTVICQTCARSKNACQSCMLDLTYGLPLSIRDAALNMANKGSITSSSDATNVIMKQYIAQNLDASKELQVDDEDDEGQLVISDAAKTLLRNLAQAMPYYRGPPPQSNSGSSKPNEVSTGTAITGAMKANVNKIVSKLPLNGSISIIPKDETITSFFISGVEDDLPDYKVRDYFSSFGTIKGLILVHRARSGFITFEKRIHAEAAANSLKSTNGRFVINGCKLKAVWGKPRSLGDSFQENAMVGAIVKQSLRNSSGKTRGGAYNRTGNNGKSDSKSAIALPPPGSVKGSYESQKAGYER